jgi:hypothetical protein
MDTVMADRNSRPGRVVRMKSVCGDRSLVPYAGKKRIAMAPDCHRRLLVAGMRRVCAAE